MIWEGLGNLLYGVDYTREWVDRPSHRLEFDFDRFALCGVSLGDPVDCLRDVGLGRAEDRRQAGQWALYYYSKGIFVEADEFSILEYSLIWRDSGGKRFQPFAGLCSFCGKELSLADSTSPADIVEAFGEPNEREEADDRVLAFIYRYREKHGDTVMEVDFGEEERLHEISVVLEGTDSGD